MRSNLYSTIKQSAALKRINNVNVPLYYKNISSNKTDLGGENTELINIYNNNLVNIVNRNHYSIFNISGKTARKFLNRLVLSDMNNLSENKSFNTVMLNEHGGIKDYVTVCNLGNSFNMITSPSNSLKIIRHLKHENNENNNINEITEQTKNEFITLLGSNAYKSINKLLSLMKIDYNSFNMKLFETQMFKVNDDSNLIVTRNINCGVNAYDVIIPTNKKYIVKKIQNDDNIRFVGDNAYNMANVEAGHPIYGLDIDENVNPIEARLKWMIPKSSNGKTLIQDFIGSDHIYTKHGYIKRYPNVRVKMYSLDKNSSIPKKEKSIKSFDEKTLGYITNVYYSLYSNKVSAYGYVNLMDTFETTNIYNIRTMNKRVLIDGIVFHLEIM
tara:strand:+ start:4090 stop:5244 length:1155 start_codon:yes stop_codon:yes gene_type:complete